LAKEISADYDGESCARNWIKQVQNIARTYDLDDGRMSWFFISKLKGNAQSYMETLIEFWSQ